GPFFRSAQCSSCILSSWAAAAGGTPPSQAVLPKQRARTCSRAPCVAGYLRTLMPQPGQNAAPGFKGVPQLPQKAAEGLEESSGPASGALGPAPDAPKGATGGSGRP